MKTQIQMFKDIITTINIFKVKEMVKIMQIFCKEINRIILQNNFSWTNLEYNNNQNNSIFPKVILVKIIKKEIQINIYNNNNNRFQLRKFLHMAKLIVIIVLVFH